MDTNQILHNLNEGLFPLSLLQLGCVSLCYWCVNWKLTRVVILKMSLLVLNKLGRVLQKGIFLLGMMGPPSVVPEVSMGLWLFLPSPPPPPLPRSSFLTIIHSHTYTYLWLMTWVHIHAMVAQGLAAADRVDGQAGVVWLFHLKGFLEGLEEWELIMNLGCRLLAGGLKRLSRLTSNKCMLMLHYLC